MYKNETPHRQKKNLRAISTLDTPVSSGASPFRVRSPGAQPTVRESLTSTKPEIGRISLRKAIAQLDTPRSELNTDRSQKKMLSSLKDTPKNSAVTARLATPKRPITDKSQTASKSVKNLHKATPSLCKTPQRTRVPKSPLQKKSITYTPISSRALISPVAKTGLLMTPTRTKSKAALPTVATPKSPNRTPKGAYTPISKRNTEIRTPVTKKGAATSRPAQGTTFRTPTKAHGQTTPKLTKPAPPFTNTFSSKALNVLLSYVRPHECVLDALAAVLSLISPDFNEALGSGTMKFEWKVIKSYFNDSNKVKDMMAILKEKLEGKALEKGNITNAVYYVNEYNAHLTNEVFNMVRQYGEELINYVKGAIKYFDGSLLLTLKEVGSEKVETKMPKSPHSQSSTQVDSLKNSRELVGLKLGTQENSLTSRKDTEPKRESLAKIERQNLEPLELSMKKEETPVKTGEVIPIGGRTPSGLFKKKPVEAVECINTPEAVVVQSSTPVVIKAYLTNPENSKSEELSQVELQKREEEILLAASGLPLFGVCQQTSGGADFSFDHKMSCEEEYFVRSPMDMMKGSGSSSLLWTKSSISKQTSSSLISLEENNNNILCLLDDGHPAPNATTEKVKEKLSKKINKKLEKINSVSSSQVNSSTEAPATRSKKSKGSSSKESNESGHGKAKQNQSSCRNPQPHPASFCAHPVQPDAKPVLE